MLQEWETPIQIIIRHKFFSLAASGFQTRTGNAYISWIKISLYWRIISFKQKMLQKNDRIPKFKKALSARG